ncbi:MAG: biotin carboxyl carrier protein [Desulforhopalus sp.]|jgi:biotin carboxyl carrier protein
MKKFRVLVNGSEYNVEIEELSEGTAAPRTAASPPAPSAPKPATPAPAKPAQAASAPQKAAVGGAIVAPMPGTILAVEVEVGAVVTKGQTLLVLEAMKMENEIQAPADGTVQELNVSQGLSVNAGDTLIVLS